MTKEIERIREEINGYYENWFRINHAYAHWALRHNTTDNILFALHTIAHSGSGCTQQQICYELLLPKQTVSFLLSKLEEQGLICRRPNPSDRRNKLVFLTEQGDEYAQSILGELESAEIRAYQSLSKSERKAVTEGYSALARSLEKSLSGD